MKSSHKFDIHEKWLLTFCFVPDPSGLFATLANATHLLRGYRIGAAFKHPCASTIPDLLGSFFVLPWVATIMTQVNLNDGCVKCNRAIMKNKDTLKNSILFPGVSSHIT